MNCETCRELIWAYIEQELTAEENQKIEQHFTACPTCREEAKQQQALLDSLKSLPEAELPEGYHEELMQKLKAETKPNIVPFPVKKKQPKWKQFSLVAAAALIVVAAGGMNGILEMRQETVNLETEANVAMVKEETMAKGVSAADTEETTVDTNAAQQVEHSKKAAKQDQHAPMMVNDTADSFTVYEEEAESNVAAMPEMAPVTEELGNPLIRSMEVVKDADYSIIVYTAELKTTEEKIHVLILDVEGQEDGDSSEGHIYAQIPSENTETFFEKLNTFGEIQWIRQGSEVNDSIYNRVEIQLKTNE